VSFLFLNLEVYGKAVDWAQEVEALSKELKGKIAFPFIDQLIRAALSISLNIAEGNGRWHKGDKRQFYYVARGSAFECVPIIELLRRSKALDDAKHSTYMTSLDEISKMLTRLIRSVEKMKQ
jgi:four helix bundle protein